MVVGYLYGFQHLFEEKMEEIFEDDVLLIQRILSDRIQAEINLRLEKDDESGWYIAKVYELPGCVSQGETLEAAKINISDAIEAYIEVLLEDALREMMLISPSLSKKAVVER